MIKLNLKARKEVQGMFTCVLANKNKKSPLKSKNKRNLF